MLKDYSVRLMTEDDYHFIVPVRAGDSHMAGVYAVRFIQQIYKVLVVNHIVRFKGHALPTWCKKAKRLENLDQEKSKSAAKSAAKKVAKRKAA